jgi:methionyl-tRNA formyltransferase
MRIVFMGTPEFAVAPLKALIENGYEIAAVITAPDKPAGRGKKIQSSAVKNFALSQGLKVLQPEKLKSEDFISELKNINPDLQIVVAFRMLPEIVWNIPKMGTFNLHASLLPDYRGAAPLNHAIINGDALTGLTTFFIDEKIDNGQIILQERLEIGPVETAGELHDRMMIKGSELVLKTVKLIEAEEVTPISQSKLESNLLMRPAPKIFKEDCHINWNKPVSSIHNLIRGLSPYPGAFALLKRDGKMDNLNVKIFHSTPVVEKHEYRPGSILSDNKNNLKVAAEDGFIEILELQMAGKNKQLIKDFLRGFIFNIEDSFC